MSESRTFLLDRELLGELIDCPMDSIAASDSPFEALPSQLSTKEVSDLAIQTFCSAEGRSPSEDGVKAENRVLLHLGMLAIALQDKTTAESVISHFHERPRRISRIFNAYFLSRRLKKFYQE